MDQLWIALIALGTGIGTALITAITSRGKTTTGFNDLKAQVEKNHQEITSKLSAQDTQIAAVSTKVDKVEKEVTDNGGGSMKDGVGMIRRAMKLIQNKVEELGDIAQVNSSIQLNQCKEPILRLNKDGECEFVNEKMVELVGIPYSKMLVRGFLKAIGKSQAERLEFHEQIVESAKGDVPFCKDCAIMTAGGDFQTCEIKMTAYKRKDREANHDVVLFFLVEVKLKDKTAA